MLTFTLISFLILVAFTVIGGRMYGKIPESYSTLGTFFGEYAPGAPVNPWSAVTFLVAFLMLPPMIGAGEGNLFQCFGFFAPLYLIVVSVTPRWASDRRELRVHVIGTLLCAVLALAWLFVVQKAWWIFAACFVAAVLAGYFTKSLIRCKMLWGEAVLFFSVYVSLILGG